MNTRRTTFSLGDISLSVVRKDIKHVHLSVRPPLGAVGVSAPMRMNQETIRLFCVSKLNWIKTQRAKFLAQKREPARMYVNRESHYYLGKRYLLKVSELDAAPSVVLGHETIELRVRPGAGKAYREALLHAWYRQRLQEFVARHLAGLEKAMSVRASSVRIRTMRTRWGTCNPKARRIWLNTELAKKPAECIEYVLVHELAHLLEKSHNHRFVAIMDQFLPNWTHTKAELNRAALGHAEWVY